MTASGFSCRAFRARRRRTAASLVPSAARWKPPSPRMATISPSRSRWAAARIEASFCATGRPEASSQTRGPHAGQLFVCEWQRRSAGSRYSRRHSGHCWKSRMLRSSASQPRHSATSGEIGSRRSGRVSLATISKRSRFSGATDAEWSESMRARGGRSVGSSCTKACTSGASPSIRTFTSPDSLRTQPASRYRLARRAT